MFIGLEDNVAHTVVRPGDFHEDRGPYVYVTPTHAYLESDDKDKRFCRGKSLLKWSADGQQLLLKVDISVDIKDSETLIGYVASDRIAQETRATATRTFRVFDRHHEF